jgi:aminomethyltransferase
MSLKRTPFFDCHVLAKARIIEFCGFEMPVQYSGIIDEHRAVRTSVGLFDVSHMGEVWIRGPRAMDAVQGLVTNDAASIVNGQAMYTAMCNDHGGIVDDLLVYRVSPTEFLICVNAANREKDFNWMYSHNPCPDGASVTDESDSWGQVALQGRHAEATLQKLTSLKLSELQTYHFVFGTVGGIEGCIVARTGYTGEDGFEVFVPADRAAALWPALLEAGAEFEIKPIGLGARDTLRLEAKYCLYGNDITDDTTPLEAGLGWVTRLEKTTPFVGQGPLLAQRDAGIPRRLVCMVVKDRIARQHCPILLDGEQVGEVTSGTRAPWVDQNIALGYVPTRLAKPGTHVQIDIRGRFADAEVVKPPFYKRPY